MASSTEYLKFFNGHRFPAFGLGTWRSNGEELENALEVAFEAGYRYIDTSPLYGNEAEVGKIIHRWISSGKIKRKDIFLLTKVPGTGNTPAGIRKYMQRSLNALQVDYVDLFLIHSSIGKIERDDGKEELDLNTDHIAIWKAMEELVDSGKAKSIGLANWNSRQVQRVLEHARIQPANLQVELHVFLQQNELVEFCKRNNIIVTAYSPLFNQPLKFVNLMGFDELPSALNNPVITHIANKHNKTPAQVMLRQLVQRGIVPIPKSVTPQRIRENIDVFNFELDEDDMSRIAALNQGLRLFNLLNIKGYKDHPEYPFSEIIKDKAYAQKNRYLH